MSQALWCRVACWCADQTVQLASVRSFLSTCTLGQLTRVPSRYFGSLEYDWRGLSQQPTVLAKAKRSFAQLGPRHYDKFHWHAFSSPLRCLECLGPLAIILLCEVCGCVLLL